MINFVLTASKNYRLVQSQINSAIQAHLPAGTWTESNEEYVEGALNFTLFIDKEADVLMSHGAADKGYHFRKDPSNGDIRLNHVRRRKHLLVPGEWLRKRIIKSERLDFGPDQVHSVGWPRLDALISAQRLVEPRAKKKKKTVLWAPTHDFARYGPEKETLSSFPAFEEFVGPLSERYKVLTSLHPRNRKNKVPTGDALLRSDVVISDIGTMVYEAVALGKQVIFPTWIIGDPIRKHMRYCAESVCFRNNIGLHAKSYDDLIQMIDDGERMNQKSLDFFDSYIAPETYGRSAQLVAEKLQELERLPR